MLRIDTPNIMTSATPEQNIMAIKGWITETAYELNVEYNNMQSEIDDLKKEIEELKEANNGV